MPKLESKTVTWIWTISGCMAVLSVLPLINVCSEDSFCGMFLGVFLLVGFAGAILSAMVSNIHDPNPVLVVVFNWIIFASVAIVVAKLLKGRKEKRRAANA